ncbi:MAG TPA: hypothetical protein PKY96_07870 [Flavobacteriales bacterium]|nr:hypothetical protein [Flavobacteriales bacterium]
MKIILALACLPFTAFSQPGPDLLFMEPCGMGRYGVALQDTKRFDVQVSTYGVGTDDVPSSSGNCIRNVSLYEHADFLLEKDQQGYYIVHAPHAGDVLHPDSLKAGLASGRFKWGKYTLPICYRGYGSQFDGKGWHLHEPRTWERSIVRLTTPEATYLVAMTIAYLEPHGIIEVRGRRVVLGGEPLPIH